MAKVFIGIGHGGKDSGAVANGLRESEINLIMGLACRDELMRYGIEVGISRERDEADLLADEIRECNAFKPDCAIEIHNNAGGGDGFEVFRQTGVHAADSLALAALCEDEVKKLGQNSRGVKTRLNTEGKDWYGWLRSVNYPAVLLEGAFLDTKDHEIIDTVDEQRAFGVAYAHAVMRYLGIVPNPNTGEDDLREKYNTLEASVQALRGRILAAVDAFDNGKGDD